MSVRTFVRLSVRVFQRGFHWTDSVKLAMGDVYENCIENPNLVKIEQIYWILHMETQACCL